MDILRVVSFALVLMLAPFSACCQNNQSGVNTGRIQAKETLHAKPWAFGRSSDRDAALWHNGIDGNAITHKSSPKKAANTSSGIDQALIDAQKKSRKGKLGVSMENESTTWKVSPQQKSLRPDEDKVRDSRHVVRAYAGVEAGDDFNISVGPELILKDEGHGEDAAKSDQPDSVLGLGMKFQYDF